MSLARSGQARGDMRSMETAHSQVPALGRSRRSPSRCHWSSASALQGEERNEPGENDGRGPSLSPQASLKLEGTVALLSQLHCGSSCWLHEHRGRGSARSTGPASPTSLRELPGLPHRPRHTRQLTLLYFSAWKEIKLTVPANRRPVCLCCWGQGFQATGAGGQGVHSACQSQGRG